MNTIYRLAGLTVMILAALGSLGCWGLWWLPDQMPKNEAKAWLLVALNYAAGLGCFFIGVAGCLLVLDPLEAISLFGGTAR